MIATCSPIPGFDPVLLSIGPLDLRWYAMAYIAGLLLGWRYMLRLVDQPKLWTPAAAKDPSSPLSRDDVDELLFLATMGVIFGGRIGYVLFYNIGWLGQDLATLFTLFGDGFSANAIGAKIASIQFWRIWDGGMSFHGGLLGVGAAIWWLARSRKLEFLRIADAAAVVAPIGIFFGRVANFINGELYGRPWDGPWAMRFPCDRDATALGVAPFLRHPSQVYEALLEGLVLFIILRVATHHRAALQNPGLTTGVFLVGYGVFRSFVENFREPDAHLGDPAFGITRGMLLSGPMIIGGGFLIWRAMKAGPTRAAGSA